MLYPALLMAALTIIVVSVIGIMVAIDILPGARSGGEPATNRASLESRSGDTGKAPASTGLLPDKSNTSRSATARTAVTSSESCSDCGVIESMTLVGADVHGSAQVQTGIAEKDASVSAAGKMEKTLVPVKRYQILVRMDNGSGLLYEEADVSAYAIGQKVRATRAGIAVTGG
jgi:hypothetical protein